MKVSTITLGCKVNQYETQAMLNQLLQGGFSACQTGEDADIILLNSCTVTSTSDHKVENKHYIRPVESIRMRLSY
ncbi:MAG: hypothetical protein ACLSCV_10085 [Acutalibacteraceae bacterium]